MLDSGTVLGIDHGAARIGIALSDPLGITARPLETIHTGETDPLARIEQLVRDHSVKAIVIGLPLRMNDSEGPQAEAARAFAAALKPCLPDGIPIHLVDERLSTREAEKHLARSGKKGGRKANKDLIDQAAAAVILQDYLDNGC